MWFYMRKKSNRRVLSLILYKVMGKKGVKRRVIVLDNEVILERCI